MSFLRHHAVTFLVAAWCGFLLHSYWLDLHACDGHPCGLWQDVVRKSPDKPRGYINLGEAYRKKGDYADAITAYQQAEVVSQAEGRPEKERETTDLIATTDIAAILMAEGQMENAHQILKQAWLRYPSFPGFAVGLSSFYIQNNEPMKAVAFLNEGIDRGLQEFVWFRAIAPGQLYFQRGIAWQMLKQCDLANEDYGKTREYGFPRIPPSIQCQ